MLNLNGSHGTSNTRAQEIKESNFKIQHGKLFGDGVYFWCESSFSSDLAIGWYKFCYAKGKYNSDEDKSCAIILVGIEIDESEFLNFEADDIKKQLRDFALKNNINIQNKIKLAKIIKLFLEELKNEEGRYIKVFNKKVSPPPFQYCPQYSYKLLGYPDCLVCLAIDYIQINEIRNME